MVEVEGIDARDGHAQGIADKIADVVIFEKCRVLGEHGTLLWLFDVRFENHQAVFAGFVEQVVHHFERVNIGLLAELGTAKDAADSSSDLLEDVKRICDQKSTDGGTADDNQFCRLNENSEVAMLHQVARHDATENDDDADNGKHG